MREFWNKEDTDYLIKNFFDISNDELSKKLNRTKISIQIKAYKLGLKKNPKTKSDATIKKNKEMGRDLTYDFLKIGFGWFYYVWSFLTYLFIYRTNSEICTFNIKFTEKIIPIHTFYFTRII